MVIIKPSNRYPILKGIEGMKARRHVADDIIGHSCPVEPNHRLSVPEGIKGQSESRLQLVPDHRIFNLGCDDVFERIEVRGQDLSQSVARSLNSAIAAGLLMTGLTVDLALSRDFILLTVL